MCRCINKPLSEKGKYLTYLASIKQICVLRELENILTENTEEVTENSEEVGSHSEAHLQEAVMSHMYLPFKALAIILNWHYSPHDVNTYLFVLCIEWTFWQSNTSSEMEEDCP